MLWGTGQQLQATTLEPCFTTGMYWCCRKTFSQWEHSLYWKQCRHLLKGLRQYHVAEVILDRNGGILTLSRSHNFDPVCFCPWTFSLNIGLNMFPLDSFMSMFTFPTRIFYRGVPGYATDCPCSVWCCGLTTCPLYVGPLFGNLV